MSDEAQQIDGLLFLLLDVARQCMDHFERCRDETVPLTLRVCRTVLQVARHQGLNQQELAVLSDFDSTSLVRVLDRLEQRGWVRRLPDPADRRAHRIVLGERAGPPIGLIRSAVRSTALSALREVSQQERALLVKSLQRMQNSLEHPASRIDHCEWPDDCEDLSAT
jgi:MarR family transcriptional regulator, transcriptional regulator for hemolysin